jgi:glycosyltransferase involved in cell wall biosynthesis
MKIVQVSEGRHPSPVHVGGGDVRRWQNLRSLRALGHEVHVLVCDPLDESTDALRELATSVTTVHARPTKAWNPRKWVARGLNPETLRLALPNLFGLATQTEQRLQRLNPDLVWAEGAYSVLLCSKRWPVIHSHHDFMFKLRPVRRKIFAKKFRRPDALSLQALEKLEFDVCRRASFNVCASLSEAEQIRTLGGNALYVPIVGDNTAPPDFERLSSGRMLLFGNPNTAMRAARSNLQEEIWPLIERQPFQFEWHQVGKEPRPGADPSWPFIEMNFTVHGYVANLDEVLRPGDGSIMPYAFDTGGRAKFGICAGYGVVNIGYEETFRCARELTHRENCLAAESAAHFVELITEYCSDDAFRLRLAKGSRAAYEQHYTLEAQLHHYARVLEQVSDSGSLSS